MVARSLETRPSEPQSYYFEVLSNVTNGQIVGSLKVEQTQIFIIKKLVFTLIALRRSKGKDLIKFEGYYHRYLKSAQMEC